MADDQEQPFTGHRLIDLVQASASRPFRVFKAAVGSDKRRQEAARKAWERLDPMLLPDSLFDEGEFSLLTRCILDEVKRQNAPTTLPQPSTAEAETLPPMAAVLSPPPPPSNLPLPLVVEPNFLLKKAAEAKAAQGTNNAGSGKEPAQVQLALPAVAEPERAAPTLWLRSAIFGVVGRGKREDRRMQELPTPWVKGNLYFTGIQLAQDDLDVMLQMLHLASSQGGPGQPIHFSDRGITKALGRSYGSKTLAWLDDVAHRLMAAVILFDDGSGTNGQFHLVRSYARNAKTGQRAFVLDPEVMTFFADRSYTVLQWEQRLRLGTGLAKWLHGFLMSQPSSANGIGLRLLKEMSGVSAKRALRLFKHDLNLAITEICDLHDVHLGLSEIRIVDGKDGPKLTWRRHPDRRQALNSPQRS